LGRISSSSLVTAGYWPRVIVLSGLNENRRRALILADNKLALSAGWDEEALRLEIEALRDARSPHESIAAIAKLWL
jgi:hypothetical protein